VIGFSILLENEGDNDNNDNNDNDDNDDNDDNNDNDTASCKQIPHASITSVIFLKKIHSKLQDT